LGSILIENVSTNELMNLKSKKVLFLIVIAFGVIYSLISLVNHYCFRTYALDLGLYTNALYDYIHFQWNDSTVFKEVKENLLADHFDLYLIIFSPFSLLFKSYTLLIIQIFFILLGGIGIYKYFSLFQKKENFGIIATMYYFSFFGVFSAVSCDYHSNVIAASIIPWLFYYIKKEELILTSFLILFIIISKENISLWVSFICLGLLIIYRGNRLIKTYLFIVFCACISYFILVTNVIMPWISNSSIYPHFNYSYLGTNGIEAIGFLIMNPLDSIQTLFINHTHDPLGDYVKTEFHIIMMLSGLPILFFKPQYIIMLIPIFFQKLFHNSYYVWGIDGQYSIEYAPILAIGIYSIIIDFKKSKMVKILSFITLFSTLFCTIHIMDSTILYTAKSKIRFYQLVHYKRNYSVTRVHNLLSKIPKDAVVSAQSPFLPHLALRNYIYQFPIIKDAEFIVYSRNEGSYPIETRAFDSLTLVLEKSSLWRINFKDKDLTILQKVNTE